MQSPRHTHTGSTSFVLLRPFWWRLRLTPWEQPQTVPGREPSIHHPATRHMASIPDLREMDRPALFACSPENRLSSCHTPTSLSGSLLEIPGSLGDQLFSSGAVTETQLMTDTGQEAGLLWPGCLLRVRFLFAFWLCGSGPGAGWEAVTFIFNGRQLMGD